MNAALKICFLVFYIIFKTLSLVCVTKKLLLGEKLSYAVVHLQWHWISPENMEKLTLLNFAEYELNDLFIGPIYQGLL